MGAPSQPQEPIAQLPAERWASEPKVGWEEHPTPLLPSMPSESSSKPPAMTFKQRVREVFEDPRRDCRIDKGVMYFLFFMILFSISAFVLESIPALDFIPKEMWNGLEWVCTAVFTLEYVLRFWACNADGLTTRTQWATRPMCMCDLLATSPSYIEACVTVDGMSVLRVARVFRLFKLGRHSPGFKVMTTTLAGSFTALKSLFFLFCIGIILFSSAVYYTERLSCPAFDDSSTGRKNFHDYVHECYDEGVSATFGTCCAYRCKGMSPRLSNSLIGGICRYHGDLSTDRRLAAAFSLEDLVPTGFPENQRGLQETEEEADAEIDLLTEMLERKLRVMPLHALGYKSIIETFWWCCVTMTTVGYGEITPMSWLSRFVAAAAMLSGIMLIALPVAVVGTKFHETYAEIMHAHPEPFSEDSSEYTPPRQKKHADDHSPSQRSPINRTPDVSNTLLREASPHIVRLREALAESLQVKGEILEKELEVKTLWASAEQAMARLCYEGILSHKSLLASTDVDTFCKRSLFLFDIESPFRQSAIQLMRWVWFERFSLFLIVTNGVLLAIQNHRDLEAPQNKIQTSLELVFTVCFTLECVVKIIAMGFFLDKNSYLRDAWNWLDFIVVVSGLVTMVIEEQQSGDSADLGMMKPLRTFRALRPLRSLSAMPGMRALVNTLMLSLPKLLPLVGMALFLLVTFGILGVNFWGGVMHRRCRITNVPLRFTPKLNSGCSGICLDSTSLVPVGSGFINSSVAFEAFCRPDEEGCLQAWKKGEDFLLWPIDPDQGRFCGGRYECGIPETTPSHWYSGEVSFAQVANEVLAPLGVPITGEGDDLNVGQTYCGNALNDDESYGPRTAHNGYDGEHLDLWEREVNQEDFFWGITHYDHLGCAFLVIFQSITLEGWVDIMYLLQDAHSDGFATLYFFALILIGSFFLLNITLVIVADAFASESEKSAEEKSAEDEEKAASASPSDDADMAKLFSESSAPRSRLSMLKVAHVKSLGRVSEYKVINYARKISASEGFSNFIMLIIVLNVVTLGLDRYPPLGRQFEDFLDVTNTIFSIIFLIEFIILQAAHGFYRYWTNPVLAFDGFIVLSSLMEMTMKGGSAVTALRGFRLLRIFKLAKKWESFRLLLKSILETVLQMGNFCLLLVLMITVFTLVGQSFFARKFTFDDDGIHIPEEKREELCPDWECVPRSHFDTFAWGFITIFQILSGENWNTVMYDGMKSAGWPLAVYFIFVVVVGNLLILNLFLAILIGNFQEANQKAIEEARKSKDRKKTGNAKKDNALQVAQLMSFKGMPGMAPGPSTGGPGGLEKKEEGFQSVSPSSASFSNAKEKLGQKFSNMRNSLSQTLSSPSSQPSSEDNSSQVVAVSPGNSPVRAQHTGSVPDPDSPPQQSQGNSESQGPRTFAWAKDDAWVKDDGANNEKGESDQKSPKKMENQVRHFDDDDVVTRQRSEDDSHHIADLFQDYQNHKAQSMKMKEKKKPRREASLLIFSETGTTRKFLTKIVVHRYFDRAILLFIVISSVLMAVSNPLSDPGSPKELAVYWLNFIFTIIFTAELVVKVVAYGLLFGKKPYLRNPWNILDALIVVICLVEFLPFSGGNLAAVKVLRILRALRPLRLISRYENLKLVVNTLFKSVPELCNLLIVGSLFFLIFGLFGVSYLKGSFYRCADVNGDDYSFNQTVPYTPLCVPPIENGGEVLPSWNLLDDCGADCQGACGPKMEPWWRLTPKTPICQRVCKTDSDAPAASLCQNDEEWLGFRVMRCTDCASLMCGDSIVEQEREHCTKECEKHAFFCGEEDGNNVECQEQCIAQCACSSYCNGLAEEAALCAEQGGRWLNQFRNFDNVFNAILTLFEIATTEGWVDTMYHGVDGRGPMLQPLRDNMEIMAWFFVGFILIGSFFVLNLCVGVIIDNFNQMKAERDQSGEKGGLLMTDTQQSWVAAQKAVIHKKQFFALTNLQDLPPWRVKLYLWVSSAKFENMIMACICLNTVVMAMQITPTPSKEYDRVLSIGNIIFAGVFNIEAAVKLVAIRRNYFKENWNCFDFVCVVATDAGLVVGQLSDVPLGTVVSAIRLFRIARLFRLVRFLKGLNQLFMAFVLSLPKLANVGTILLLLMFLYAVLGVNLFAKVRSFGAHDEFAHFRTFYRAIVTLARCMTGEAWNELMHALTKDKHFFGAYTDQICLVSMDISSSEKWQEFESKGQIENPIECGTPIAGFYFVTYTLFVTFVILNLFIAVIFEGFDDSQKNIEGEIIQKCMEVWKQYDPDYTLVISIEEAFQFIDLVLLEVVGAKDMGKDRRRVTETPHQLAHKAKTQNMSHEDKKNAYESYYYNLHYLTILDLQVFPNEHKVHFVRAVLSVLRYVICKKDLQASHTASKEEERYRIKELEDVMAQEVLKENNVEDKTQKVVTKTCSLHSSKEIPFIQLVAASKIQRQFKELFQRKRNRQAQGKSSNSGHSPSSSKGPINRAAG